MALRPARALGSSVLAAARTLRAARDVLHCASGTMPLSRSHSGRRHGARRRVAARASARARLRALVFRNVFARAVRVRPRAIVVDSSFSRASLLEVCSRHSRAERAGRLSGRRSPTLRDRARAADGAHDSRGRNRRATQELERLIRLLPELDGAPSGRGRAADTVRRALRCARRSSGDVDIASSYADTFRARSC